MRAQANKQDELVVSSAARTATHNATFISRHTGGLFIIDVTAVTATPTLTMTIQGVEPESGNTWTILASAGITSTGTTVLRVHPSLTASANAIAKDMLPQAINLNCAHTDTDSITYSVRYVGMD